MEFIFENADFSANNVGNTRWSENWMIARGITDPTKKAAVRAFYNGMANGNLIDKFEFLYIMNSTSADLDRLNVLNPYDEEGTYRLTFQADIPAAHTVNGYIANEAASRFAFSEYKINNATQLNNFHMHVFNKTADSSGRYLGGTWINSGGSAVFVALTRNSTGFTRGGVTTHNSVPELPSSPSGYDLTKTGLLSFTKAGTTQKLFDNGTLIGGPVTMSPAYTVTSPQQIYVGTAGLYTTAWISTAAITLAAGGSPTIPMTDGDVATFATLVNTLLAAL
jgi:hypothetical protein